MDKAIFMKDKPIIESSIDNKVRQVRRYCIVIKKFIYLIHLLSDLFKIIQMKQFKYMTGNKNVPIET